MNLEMVTSGLAWWYRKYAGECGQPTEDQAAYEAVKPLHTMCGELCGPTWNLSRLRTGGEIKAGRDLTNVMPSGAGVR